jgi:hypothetical protein
MLIFKPSARFVDMIINHPQVRATVQQGAERLFSEAVVESPINLCVAFEQGVAVFRYIAHRTYDGHIFALEGSRGAVALQFGRLALAKLSERCDADHLYTAVPLALPAARAYCRRLGLKAEDRDLFNEYFSAEVSQWAV